MLVAVSAIVAKHLTTTSGTAPALLAMTGDDGSERTDTTANEPDAAALGAKVGLGSVVDPLGEEFDPEYMAASESQPLKDVQIPVIGAPFPAGAGATNAAPTTTETFDPSIRWFNGRPVRPARSITMLVTAYSPDERSCPGTADGVTASLHRVETNDFRLVAADPKVLPLGAMISVPGYDTGQIVPVLDRGGKIKGNHIDVLFATDAEARRWGVKRLKVTVWEYADGQGAANWRGIRDSK
jgi:3D (Asp-Asp-Asp) domain-containing protein